MNKICIIGNGVHATKNIIPSLKELSVSIDAISSEYLKDNEKISYVESKYEALKGADALILITEWKEFRMPSWSAIKKLMATPLVLDGRNIYDIKEMEENGFVYHCIGR